MATAPTAIVAAAWSLSSVPEKRTIDRLSLTGRLTLLEGVSVEGRPAAAARSPSRERRRTRAPRMRLQATRISGSQSS